MTKKPWKIDERDAPSPRRYMQAVRAWMRQVQAVIGSVLLAQLADAKKDEDEGPVDPVEAERQARRLRDRLRQAKIPPPPIRLIEGAGESAARQASRRSRQQIIKAGVPATTLSKRLGIDEAELLGIDIAPSALERAALTAWATEGSDLIVSVGQDLVEGLDQHIMEAARAGTLARDLRQIVQDRLGISERHALFIARDQIAKLNGKITEAAQVSAGLTRYRWRSSNDQRTRPDHLALDGTIQEWSSPPIVDQKTGRREHPGGDFSCRCVALAVLDGEDEKEQPSLTRRPDVEDLAVSPYSPEQDEAARSFLGRGRAATVTPAPRAAPTRRASRAAPVVPVVPPPVRATAPTPKPPPPSRPASAPVAAAAKAPKRSAPSPSRAAVDVPEELAQLPQQLRTLARELSVQAQTLQGVKQFGGFKTLETAREGVENLVAEGLVTKRGELYAVTDRYREIVAKRRAGETDDDLMRGILGL